jgi:hypothetical protein
MHARHLPALGCAAVLAVGLNTAHAGGTLFDIGNQTYREECGSSCHVAFPPQLLPAASWRALLAMLDRHFGTDASLDARQANAILDFLVPRADRREAMTADGKPALRISELPWFRGEHDEIALAVWKRPEVKSAANCGACHRNAETGDYRERTLRVPK